jgi:hypothetical protein
VAIDDHSTRANPRCVSSLLEGLLDVDHVVALCALHDLYEDGEHEAEHAIGCGVDGCIEAVPSRSELQPDRELDGSGANVATPRAGLAPELPAE